MLRLIAAQATGPRTWLAARVAAIMAWALPTTLAGLVLVLALAGVDFSAALPELASTLLVVTAYIFFWTGIAFVVLARLPDAAAGLGALAAIWAVLTLGLPMAGAAITAAIAPAPSVSGWIDAQRRTTDAVQRDRDRILARAFGKRPDLAGAAGRLATLDHATRQTFLVPETERRLNRWRTARAAHRREQARFAALAGFLAPPLGLTQALATLAGTDGDRQRRFEAQARSYQLDLRGLLYPLVQHEAGRPTPKGMSRGRYSLADPDIIPVFTMTDASPRARAAAVLPFAGWLLLTGLALAVLGLRRADRWAL